MKFLTRQTYEAFIAESGIDMSFEQWKLVIKAHNLNWRAMVLRNAFGFELPGLGVVAVDKYEGKHPLLNLADSMKLGKPVPYLNLHTFGYRYKIKWYKHRIVNFKYHRLYHFDACREMKRELAAILKSGADPFENIRQSTLREKMRLKKFLEKKWA